MSALITHRGTVYPWQCDHVGHMNVMWYVGKLDEGTWNLLASIGLTPTYLRTRDRGMAAVQQNITYHRELLAGDLVEVRSRIVEARSRVIRFTHVMHNAATGDLAATCDLTAVHLDRTLRRACPLPEEILASALAAIDGHA